MVLDAGRWAHALSRTPTRETPLPPPPPPRDSRQPAQLPGLRRRRSGSQALLPRPSRAASLPPPLPSMSSSLGLLSERLRRLSWATPAAAALQVRGRPRQAFLRGGTWRGDYPPKALESGGGGSGVPSLSRSFLSLPDLWGIALGKTGGPAHEDEDAQHQNTDRQAVPTERRGLGLGLTPQALFDSKIIT